MQSDQSGQSALTVWPRFQRFDGYDAQTDINCYCTQMPTCTDFSYLKWGLCLLYVVVTHRNCLKMYMLLLYIGIAS